MNFSLPISISFLYPAFLWLLLLTPLFVALGWPAADAPDRRRRWLGLLTRLLILLILVLSLAGTQVERPIDTVTTVFLLDVSDSVGAGQRAEAENFIRQALAQKPARDQAAVILFGGDALVEQLPHPAGTMPALASAPVKTATNIERGLRLALALLPNEGGRRIVLLSDGQETEGDARRLTDLAAARQIEVSLFPLGDPLAGQTELLVEQVSAPGQARQGQTVPVEVVVTASRPAEATLRLLADGALAESRPVRLVQGRNRFSFNLPLEQAGFRRFRVEIEAAEDGRQQNNWGGAFTTVYGPPRLLLVVEGQAGETTHLAAALEAAGLTVTVMDPAALPESLSALAAYEAIILANLPATALPRSTQEQLVSFVRDLGRGLVMTGGPTSYGAGSYLRTPLEKALPVDMEVRSRSREPNVALVLAVDKSGSMGACHCDNPDLRQTYDRVPSGLPKIDIAKEAVFQATAVLGNLDYLGVVSFDSSAHWEVEPAPWIGSAVLEQSIGGIRAVGQTNIYAGLSAAEEALTPLPARIKHVILLTDGWSHAGAYEDLTTRFAEEGITLSVVAAGNGSADYLADLARRGGGQYYPAATMSEVPQIFLKETIRAVGHYIIEEPFLPVPALTAVDGQMASPILQGLDPADFPALLGYNGTTPKAAARVALLTPRGDPLLATWQYGLGRSVAWTSDLGGRWAQRWLAWEACARFAGQLVNWSLPQPDDEKLDLQISTAGGNRAILTAEVGKNSTGSVSQVLARLVGPDGRPLETELVPRGPNRYQATVSLPAQGIYLAQVTAYAQASSAEAEDSLPLASRTAGLVAPYSAEYANLEPDLTLLADLAAATGGRTLGDPAQAFAHNLVVGQQTSPLWVPLLLLAVLLFPVDVAIRRLRIGRREWEQARGWVAERVPSIALPGPAGPAERPSSAAVRAFRQARQRTRQRQAAQFAPTSEKKPVSARPHPAQSASTGDVAGSTSPSSTPQERSEETLARLKAAKKRARGDS